MHHFVLMCQRWVGDVRVVELCCAGESLALGGLDVAHMCAVVLWGCGEVLTIYGMVWPHSALVHLLMDLHGASHGCKQHLVVIEGSAEMSICRYCWCCIGLPQYVDSHSSLS